MNLYIKQATNTAGYQASTANGTQSPSRKALQLYIKQIKACAGSTTTKFKPELRLTF